MYERVGDHLQAEFDRILVALDGVTEMEVGLEDPSVDQSVTDSAEASADAVGTLATVGTTVRSIAGGKHRADRSDEQSSTVDLQTSLAELAAEIEQNLEVAREDDIDLRLDRLARLFDLSRTHLDAFLLALAPEFDRSVTAVYGRLSGTNRPIFPTMKVLETTLVRMGHGPIADDVSPGEVLATPSPLFEHDLLVRHAGTAGQPPGYDTVTVNERIVRFLKGDDSLDPTLSENVSIEHPNRTLSDLVFGNDTTETIEALHSRTTGADDPTIYYFSGEDGTGKDRLPDALTDDGTPILRADAEILEDEDLTTRLIREAALQEAAIHLEGLEAVTGSEDGPTLEEGEGDLEITTDDGLSVDTIVERLDDAPGDVFLSHTDEWKPDVDLERHRVETAHCPFPEYETRLAIWEEYRTEVAEDYLVENVATNFRLPQRDIRRAVKTARYLCRTDGDGDDVDPAAPEAGNDGSSDSTDDVFAPVDGRLERDHLYEACKRYSASNLEALAEPMEPGYSFEDIYLNDKPKTHLRELCGHLRYRGQVTSEWGFGEPGDRGDGVVALFYGPPGTGKTMAAEIIANETGLDLYRVDLSQIVNKYIGETESRLAALLEEAERSNAILLFDEADSLFGERTDVADSTDRYANNVTNFLLQRLESFDGIALLTTNKRSGIDPAFKRRIAHSILFDVPQERIRRRIWREVWPDEADVETDDFDYEFLGLFSLTPAVIRKVAKYAAYIAATEAHDGHPLEDSPTDLGDVTITFDHVILALQYAEEAGGVAVEGEFFQYEDKRRSYETQTVSRDVETLFKLKYGLGGESAIDDEAASDERPAVDDATRADAATGADGDDAPAPDVTEVEDGPRDETDAESRDGAATNRRAGQHAAGSTAATATAEPEAGTEAETATDAEAESGADSEITGDLEPEDVVRHFYDGIRTEDLDAIESLYHPDAAVEPLTRKELIAKNMNDVSIAGKLRRTADDPARVVLEFEEETDAHRIPMTVALEPDDGRWRIVSLSHGTPTELDEE